MTMARIRLHSTMQKAPDLAKGGLDFGGDFPLASPDSSEPYRTFSRESGAGIKANPAFHAHIMHSFMVCANYL